MDCSDFYDIGREITFRQLDGMAETFSTIPELNLNSTLKENNGVLRVNGDREERSMTQLFSKRSNQRMRELQTIKHTYIKTIGDAVKYSASAEKSDLNELQAKLSKLQLIFTAQRDHLYHFAEESKKAGEMEKIVNEINAITNKALDIISQGESEKYDTPFNAPPTLPPPPLPMSAAQINIINQAEKTEKMSGGKRTTPPTEAMNKARLIVKESYDTEHSFGNMLLIAEAILNLCVVSLSSSSEFMGIATQEEIGHLQRAQQLFKGLFILSQKLEEQFSTLLKDPICDHTFTQVGDIYSSPLFEEYISSIGAVTSIYQESVNTLQKLKINTSFKSFLLKIGNNNELYFEINAMSAVQRLPRHCLLIESLFNISKENTKLSSALINVKHELKKINDNLD